jgi:hypothetical protein
MHDLIILLWLFAAVLFATTGFSLGGMIKALSLLLLSTPLLPLATSYASLTVFSLPSWLTSSSPSKQTREQNM